MDLSAVLLVDEDRGHLGKEKKQYMFLCFSDFKIAFNYNLNMFNTNYLYIS